MRPQAVVRSTIRDANMEYWKKFFDSIYSKTPVERVWRMIRRMSGVKKDIEYPVMMGEHSSEETRRS